MPPYTDGLEKVFDATKQLEIIARLSGKSRLFENAARQLHFDNEPDTTRIAKRRRSLGPRAPTKYGLGKHSDQQHDSDVEPYQKLLLVAGFFYYLGNTLVKLSLLVFYLRLEDRRAFRYAVFAMLFIIGTFGFGRCVAALCQCVPLSHLWNPKQPGTCIHVVISYYVNGGIMMVTDLVIYLMPIQFLWRMEMPLKQKIGMFCLFMIGG
ncbi:hypothetical protein B0A49_04343, partial [Cryomyces minteri]